MPELPEVEHMAGLLRRWLAGRTITRAEADATRILRGSSRRVFARALRGKKLERIERRGKYLLLQFDGGVGVLSHLGMTGQWIRVAASPEVGEPRHSHARLALDDGNTLHYCDPRLFGRIAVVEGAPLDALPEIRDLGPDPLHDGIDPKALHAALARSARPVKVVIMDQAILAGVGNIQATEALFRARVHPARPGREISPREAARIARGIEASIAHTQRTFGDDTLDYLSGGAIDNPFVIYDRAGAPCPRCGALLAKITLGGRASTFCPSCQA